MYRRRDLARRMHATGPMQVLSYAALVAAFLLLVGSRTCQWTSPEDHPPIEQAPEQSAAPGK